MAFDPNWFYSTLAQSTAALVGLGGGFLVQRILQQRNEIATPRFDLLHNTRASYKPIETARQHAEQIARSLALAAGEGRTRRDAGFNDFSVTGDVYVYMHPQGVQGRANGLQFRFPLEAADRFQEAAEVAASFAKALPDSFDSYVSTLAQQGGLTSGAAAWLEEPPTAVSATSTGDAFVDAAYDQANQLRGWWRELSSASREAGEALGAFRAQLVPESFFRLLSVIVLLLLLGTIAPMLYLSARGDGSRALLIIPFTLLSLSFFGFIAAELRQLRSAGDLTKQSF